MSILPAYYQKYLECIDECLMPKNNPDKANDVRALLSEILNEYHGLPFNANYFTAYFNQLLIRLREYSYEGKTEEMRKIADSDFNKLNNNRIKKLTLNLDQLSNINKNCRNKEYFNNVRNFFDKISNDQTLEDARVVGYLNDAENFIKEFNYSPALENVIIKETDPDDKGIVSFLQKFFE